MKEIKIFDNSKEIEERILSVLRRMKGWKYKIEWI